jgi:hypothetical protein
VECCEPMSTIPPLVALEGGGTPSVLNYNVPEPISYTGRNLIELQYPASVFKELKGTEPATPPVTGKPDTDLTEWTKWTNSKALVQLDSARVQTAGKRATMAKTAPKTAARAAAPMAAAQPAAASITVLDPDVLTANLGAGKKPYIVPTQSGGVKTVYADTSGKPYPGLYLVEMYRMSNFLGDYGAGRTVQTFSLLPGEKTRISIKTYKSTTTTETATSSIFDSYTTETADSFEDSIQSENSHKESKDKTTEWYVDAEASGNWGVASASVSGGASGTTNTAREDFAKNVSTATEKHSQTASAQRDIAINTTMEQSTTSGEETAIEREIANINVGHTLNFVFRQLNQEYISLLHLVDVRVGFFNGYPDKTMEVPLHEIDALLEYCVADAAQRPQMKKDIEYALENIMDYKNQPRNFLTVREYKEQGTGTQKVVTKVKVVNRTLTSVYDPGGRNIEVDGIILSERKVVLRTDGVIVESLVGAATALDEYSRDLQEEKVKQQTLTTKLMELDAREREARLAILASKDAAAAEIYAKLFAAAEQEAETE